MIGIAGKIGPPPELLAMSAYYDQVIASRRTFLEVLNFFSQNKGYPIDYHISEFSHEMHPLEDDYFPDGIRFSVDVSHAYEAEAIVSFEMFYHYLVRVCSIYLELHPEDSGEVKSLLEKIRINLMIEKGE